MVPVTAAALLFPVFISCGREEPVVLEAPVDIPAGETITIEWLGPLDWAKSTLGTLPDQVPA